MGKRANIFIGHAFDATWAGGGTNYLVETNAGVLYAFFVEFNSDVAYRKSTDGGLTWSAMVTVYTGTVVQLSVWYDRWSGLSTDIIHVAWVDSGNDDVLYKNLDPSSDTLSAQRTIALAASTSANPALSITKTRGGNLLCAYDIDGGTEHGCAKSVDDGSAWSGVATPTEAAGAGDFLIMLPGFAADNQDAICIFWDKSASEISRKLYDDSANSWGETSIAASMTAPATSAGQFDFSATVDLANSRIVMVAWSGRDAANADLRCWTVTESAITESSANVVLNSTDDQGMAAIALDTKTAAWWAFYFGKSDGSETFGATQRLYYKISTDDGATWSSESDANSPGVNSSFLYICPRRSGPPLVWWGANFGTNNTVLTLNREISVVRPRYALGVL